MLERIVRLRMPLLFVLGCGVAMAAAAQSRGASNRSTPDLLVAGAARAVEAALAEIEDLLARDFAAMRAAVREPVPDRRQLRQDPAYRAAHETEVRKLAERRKQLALQFLDRHAGWLGYAAGRYYRGMALRLAGDDRAAYAELQRFRLGEGRHPLRDAALLEVVDCLLSSDPDFGDLEQRLHEERRLGRARRLLALLRKRKLAPDTARRVAALEPRLTANELRYGYHELAAKIEELIFEEILKDADAATREKMMADPLMRKGLRRLADPDEAAYYLDVYRGGSLEARRVYWRARDRLKGKWLRLVGRFYRENRAALDRGAGLLWKARALELVDDSARAINAYGRFRAECGDRPEAAEAGIAQVRLLIRERDNLEIAQRVLQSVEAGVLTDGERTAVAALRGHLRARLGRAVTLAALVGRPLPPLTGVSADGAPIRLGGEDPAGRPTVILGFAAWSEPSRGALAALRAVRAKLDGVRVIGVTRTFGFGWSLTQGDAGDGGDPGPGDPGPWVGEPTGPGLAVAAEREQVERLWRAASADGPLVFVATEDAPWLAAYPTMIELDGSGRVRKAAAGAVAWASFLDRPGTRK